MSEKNESRTQAIRGYVDGKIQWLWGLPENQRRAELAKLRRGIGHAPGELPELWGGLLQGMPASFYGTNGPSHEEWAVYLALTLYALHQQSNDIVCVSQPGCTLGRAVRRLAEQTVASGQDREQHSAAVQRAGYRRRNYRDQPLSAGYDSAAAGRKAGQHPAGLPAVGC